MSISSPPPLDAIDTGAIEADLEAINSDLLAMLAKSVDTLSYADVKATDATFAAGKLYKYVASTVPVPAVLNEQGEVVTPAVLGVPAHWEVLTSDDYVALRVRIELLRSLIEMVNADRSPMPSFVALLRSVGKRWGVRQ